jgi:hypothetical protein
MFGGEAANRRKRIAVADGTRKDLGRDRVAEAKVDRSFVIGHGLI